MEIADGINETFNRLVLAIGTTSFHSTAVQVTVQRMWVESFKMNDLIHAVITIEETMLIHAESSRGIGYRAL